MDRPVTIATSYTDISSSPRISVTLRRVGGKLWIACRTLDCLSERIRCSSGSSDGSAISKSLLRSESPWSSSEASRCHRLFLRIIRAELIAIRVTQVEKDDLPSNPFICTKAFIQQSWSTSSVSWLFLVICCTIPDTKFRWRLHNSTYAQCLPFCANSTNDSLLAVAIRPTDGSSICPVTRYTEPPLALRAKLSCHRLISPPTFFSDGWTRQQQRTRSDHPELCSHS